MSLSSILLAVSLTLESAVCAFSAGAGSNNSPLNGETGENLLPTSDTLSICFVGDVLLDRGVRKFVERRTAQFHLKDSSQAVNYLFTSRIDSLFRSSQLVVANLECPATEIKAPVYKRFNFRGEPTWLSVLHQHGITHCNLANNHSIDQGRKGLLSTIHHIQATGMIPFGAGKNQEEAQQPILLSNKPRKVFLLASVQMALENYPLLPNRPSVSQMTIEKLVKSIKTLKSKHPGCVVLVSLHWGAEHTSQPTAQQRMQAHNLIDSGADALICHHTHTLQTSERYKGKPIFYSIGNFIFDQTRPINTKAIAVQLKITKKNISTQTFPIQIQNCIPHLIK